jgi:hypothetical protein
MGVAMIRLLAAALAVCVVLVSSTAVEAGDRYAIIICGAAGSQAHAEQHAAWRQSLVGTLTGKFQIPPDHVSVLADTAIKVSAPQAAPPQAQPPGKDADVPRPEALSATTESPGVIAATRENVRTAIGRVAQRASRDDVVLLVLFGHSTYDGVDAKFNLVGPDIEAAEWTTLLARIPARVVFVNTTGASAPFLQRLAADGRIVITATDSPAQKYETVFAKFFADAFGQTESDLDKDGRVSVWEAFAHASGGVKAHYRQRGQLAVERPVLDDTGDGVGKEAGTPGPDGSMASRTFLDASDSPAQGNGPALSELINRRNVLEGEFDELKRRRSFMPPGDYEKERDRLLIDIARISRQIRLEQVKRS